ncbi:MAG: ABC transporter ATP-binding protein [Thermomicrobiales bacterium]|nr:ABC transporter ATP-binding protein [Thermomicrobiales bacterium]
MLRLAHYLRPYIIPLVAMVLLLIGQVVANLSLPDYMAHIVNEGIVGNDSDVILSTGLRMLLVALAGGLCTISAAFLASRIAAGFTRELRNDTFSRVEAFSPLEFSRFSTASLITRCTNDMQQIQMGLFMILRLALMAPLMGIGSVIKAYHLAPSMSWIMGVAVAVLLVIISTLVAMSLPRYSRLQQFVDRLNLVTRERLTGMRVIRAYNRQPTERQRFDEANIDLNQTNLSINRLMALMQPAMMLILNFTSIAIVWIGAHKIERNELLIGDMMAFMQYAMQVIFSFLMISMIFVMASRAAVSARRVVEILDTEPCIQDPPHPVPARAADGLIEFRDVSFVYPDAEEPVLQDITFSIRPGETTAIVGPTGSGKSTLIGLIERFYDATRGAVLLDGVDVRHLGLDDLRSRIGYVPQRANLFSGTIESNLRYGKDDATASELVAAAITAQAMEFIEQFEDRFQHPIAQGGSNVSGGQRQRLSIARALIREPEIVIFDDSFSALDFRTDANLRAALARETADKTVLIVAQRVNTIMHAEKIVVLDAGRIVGEGTHAELLRNCQVYREIAASQLSESELARELQHPSNGSEPA